MTQPISLHDHHDNIRLQRLRDKIRAFSGNKIAANRIAVFRELYWLTGKKSEDAVFRNLVENFGPNGCYVIPSGLTENRKAFEMVTSCAPLRWWGFVPTPEVSRGNRPRKSGASQKAEYDTTFLHYTAQIGDHRSFIHLIEKGAEMDLRDSHGNLAFDLLREIKPRDLLAILGSWQKRVGTGGSSADPSTTSNPPFPRSDILMDLDLKGTNDCHTLYLIVHNAKTYGLEINLVMRDDGSTRQTLFERLLRVKNGVMIPGRPSYHLLENGCDGKCLVIDPCAYLLQDMLNSDYPLTAYIARPIIKLFELGAGTLTSETFQMLMNLFSKNGYAVEDDWRDLIVRIAEGRIPGLPEKFGLDFFLMVAGGQCFWQDPNVLYKIFRLIQKTGVCSSVSCANGKCGIARRAKALPVQQIPSGSDIYRINTIYLSGRDRLNVYRILNGFDYHGTTLVLPKIECPPVYRFSRAHPWNNFEELTICHQLCTGTFQGALTPGLYRLLPVRMMETMITLTNIWWLEFGDKASREANALARLPVEILFQIFNYLL